MARKNQRKGPKFDPLSSESMSLPEVAVRVRALGQWIRSPGFRGGAARAQALDELAFLREHVWWLQYKRWRKSLDKDAWDAALEWVALDKEETEQELLETLARSAHRISVPAMGPWPKGAEPKMRLETDSEYLDRLRRIRAAFRAGPVI
jgi:hypothetical protein